MSPSRWEVFSTMPGTQYLVNVNSYQPSLPISELGLGPCLQICSGGRRTAPRHTYIHSAPSPCAMENNFAPQTAKSPFQAAVPALAALRAVQQGLCGSRGCFPRRAEAGSGQRGSHPGWCVVGRVGMMLMWFAGSEQVCELLRVCRSQGPGLHTWDPGVLGWPLSSLPGSSSSVSTGQGKCPG